MADPPPADRLPGEIKYRPPKGRPEDRPLERLHQELENHEKAQAGAGDGPPISRKK